MNHFGSSVKAIRKTSTHLTEEPKKADEIVGSYPLYTRDNPNFEFSLRCIGYLIFLGWRNDEVCE